MGASGWSYFAPYQADVEKALQQLREKVFQENKYYIGDIYYDKDRQPRYLENGLPYEKPATIDELLERSSEEGTHSILDIEHVSATPAFGTASPLSEREILDLFGIEKPDHDTILQKKGSPGLYELLEPWEAAYVLVYKNGQPDEIFFFGVSGD